MDENAPIREIPSYRKLREDVRMFSRMRRAIPLLRPLFRWLRADVDGVEETLAKLDTLAPEIEELTGCPDRFNELFADRGWILYDQMNMDLAQRAIATAEAGNVEEAEQILVDYYDLETVRRGLHTMISVKAFRPRMRLAEKALEDYAANRYHACIPVVLALLDGMVNEVHQRALGVRRGISGGGVDLTAWDSITAHQRGLGALVKVFQKGRRGTTEEVITLPYRNGIMHGIDLGYDNRIVAAKTWAALFAIREWALKAEEGQVGPPPSESKPTVRETWKELVGNIQRYKESQASQQRMEQWQPRSVRVGIDIPEQGTPEEYSADSPEHRVAEYLTLWGKRNFGKMVGCLAPSYGPPANKAPAKIREVFGSKQLRSFVFTAVRDTQAAVSEVDTIVEYEMGGSVLRDEVTFRVLSANERGVPALPNEEGARWGIINWVGKW